MLSTFTRTCVLLSPRQGYCRGYALSRFPLRRPVGSGRSQSDFRANDPAKSGMTTASSYTSDLWQTSTEHLHADSDVSGSLHRLLLENQSLYVARQLEMLQVFLGYEQCNRYNIFNETGDIVGHVVEKGTGLWSSLRRNFLATHRPIQAVVLDTSGAPLLYLTRPFAWISSRMYVQRVLDHQFDEPSLETFAEVQQRWHPLRRRYDIFVRDRASHKRILSEIGHPSRDAESEFTETRFLQIGKVDEPPLWYKFRVCDEASRPFAVISRGWGGFAREVFTDTGRYHVDFEIPVSEEFQFDSTAQVAKRTSIPSRHLSLDERAVLLALAVNIDCDYFSRHSHLGLWGPMRFAWFD